MQCECKLGAGASENHFGAAKFGTSVVLKISGFYTHCQILMYICGIQNPEIYGSTGVLGVHFKVLVRRAPYQVPRIRLSMYVVKYRSMYDILIFTIKN